MFVKEPAGHTAQSFVDLGEKVPASHFLHVVAAAFSNVFVIEPSGHTTHLDVESPEYVPAAQASHVVAPGSLRVLVIHPASHLSQSFVGVSLLVCCDQSYWIGLLCVVCAGIATCFYLILALYISPRIPCPGIQNGSQTCVCAADPHRVCLDRLQKGLLIQERGRLQEIRLTFWRKLAVRAILARSAFFGFKFAGRARATGTQSRRTDLRHPSARTSKARSHRSLLRGRVLVFAYTRSACPITFVRLARATQVDEILKRHRRARAVPRASTRASTACIEPKRIIASRAPPAL